MYRVFEVFGIFEVSDVFGALKAYHGTLIKIIIKALNRGENIP